MSSQPIKPEPVTVTPIGGLTETLPAAINGADHNGILRVEVPEPLPQGAVVRITASEKYSTTGRVLYSVPYRGLHCATIGTHQDERRREARIKVAETAHVSSLQAHAGVDCCARVADVSRSGIGLITDVWIPPETLIKVVLHSAIVFGEVRHCTPEAGHPQSLHIGVEIETVIFRNECQPSWLIAPKVLWSVLNLGFQLLAKRVRSRRAV